MRRSWVLLEYTRDMEFKMYERKNSKLCLPATATEAMKFAGQANNYRSIIIKYICTDCNKQAQKFIVASTMQLCI